MTVPNATPHRPRWPLGRFLNTLAYFGAIPLVGQLNCVQKMLGQTSSASTETMARLQQSGVILVVGSGAQLAPVLAERLALKGYRVRWLTDQKGAIHPMIQVVHGNLRQVSPLPMDLLQDVGAIVGSLTTEELEAIVPWLEASAAPLYQTRHLLFDFTQPGTRLQDWGALDDVVMGGVSESTLRQGSEGAVFTGNVSTANSGGFASVRTRNFSPPLNLSGCKGLELRVRGDGNRYKLMLRSESGWDSLAYAASFDAPATRWTTIQIPFADLRPVFRARTVAAAQPLNPSRIHALQLMLSKFEYDGSLNPHFTPGSFHLTLASLRTYGTSPTPQVVLAVPHASAHSPSLTPSLTAQLHQAKLTYALFHTGSVTEAKGTQSIVIVQNGETPGSINRSDLAQLCVEAIANPQAAGVITAVASGQGVCPAGDWDCLFSRMQS